MASQRPADLGGDSGWVPHVYAGNRLVLASLHPEYGWFEEFELCRPQDAPPPPDYII